jgi:hypothetical protein
MLFAAIGYYLGILCTPCRIYIRMIVSGRLLAAYSISEVGMEFSG